MAALITRFKTGTINSSADIAILDIDAYTNLSYQANISGSLAGTLQLWVSNDKQNFIHKDDADQAINGGQNYMVEIIGLATAYVKFVVSVNAGQGEIVLIPCAKGIG
jgi:hypothetical protein